MTIGVGTVVIAVVDCIVFRSLPFRDSDRVVRVWETNAELGNHRVISLPDLRDWASASKSFAALAMARNWPMTLGVPSGTTTINAGIATPQWFSIQSIRPQLGRFFREEEMRPGNNHVVILGDEIWRTSFGGDPRILGRQIELEGEPYRVIGVLPRKPWIYQLGYVRLWIPLSAIHDRTDNVEDRAWRGFVGLGRLAPGVTLDEARNEIRSIQERLAKTWPETDRGWGADADFLRNVVAGPVRKMLFIFLASVGLILAISCANIANLAAAFNASRQREFAVRRALGASGGRVARQIVIESILLSLIGGLLGVGIAQGGIRIFRALAPYDIPRLAEITVDLRIVAIAIALSVLSAVLFGMIPARAAARADLSSGNRSISRNDVRKVLVVGELALAFVLVIATGLMARAFARLLQWNPGFQPQNVSVAWALAKNGNSVDAVEMFDRAAHILRTIPGVTAVGQTSAGPLFGGGDGESRFLIDGKPTGTLSWFDVSPGYFPTLGIPILRGRDLSDADRNGTPRVALINAAAARRYWRGADPIGSLVTVDQSGEGVKLQWQIVGIVGDAHPFRPDEPTQPEIYWPKRQAPRRATYFVIRSAVPPATLGREAAEILSREEPALNLDEFSALDTLAGEERIGPRFNTLVVSILSALALLLAVIGTYALVSLSTAARTREIAVRLAIGAEPKRVVREVISDGAMMLVAGLLLGILGAIAMARSLSAFLFGLSPLDPLTWIGVTGIFALAVLIACWIPAARAALIDPAVSLRVE